MKITPTPGLELKKTAPATDTAKDKKLQQASKDFEAIFVRQILTSLHSDANKNNVFGKPGAGQEIYQSIYDSKLADLIAQGQGMGVGKVLYRQISQQIHSKSSK